MVTFSDQDFWNASTLHGLTAEDVFSSLVSRANGGVKVISQAAPALSTEFVKSSESIRARPGEAGSFAELIFPSESEVRSKVTRKHGDDTLFGYTSTRNSDCYPAGYGERSARALAREESTYQLKGIFPSAALSYAKLKARIEAREGDTQALDGIFTQMWGLPSESASMLPQLHMEGSEVTRMSAMEDRAYHATSGHPGHSGGYRVDTATVAPDVLGQTTPLNWPRLRTGLKAIAMVQVQGDIEIAELLRARSKCGDFRYCMGLAYGSQPVYRRPPQWEHIMERIMMNASGNHSESDNAHRYTDIQFAIASSMIDAQMEEIINNPRHQICAGIRSIANVVSEMSNVALARTVDIIQEHDRDRAEMQKIDDDGFLDEADEEMLSGFNIPRYKVTRSSLYRGTKAEALGTDRTPDMSSHGPPRLVLDMAELREANLTLPLDVPNALNMAVYLTIVRPNVRTYAYELMVTMSSILDHDDSARPASERLRNQRLYTNDKIRRLGPHLFGMTFISILELLFRNMVVRSPMPDISIRNEMWSYLSGRTYPKRTCPLPGDWRDLVHYLHDAPEGWSLYYWARMTIGRLHHSVSYGIFAPITAGEQVDALVLCRTGVRERASMWKEYYAAKYKSITGQIQDQNETRKQRKARYESGELYVPKHLRTTVDLDENFDANTYLNRKKGYDPHMYEMMVIAQAKSKFFANIDVFTVDRRIRVGLTSEKMRKLWVEFYQARWYSLSVRIKKAKERNEIFHLGPYTFEEHPWGELNEDLPTTLTEVLEYLNSLDDRAWTVEPRLIQEQFKKAIGEMWVDIANELLLLRDYIVDVHDHEANEQEEAMALSNAKTVLGATIRTPAIELPTQGYRLPMSMPSRNIAILTESTSADAPIQTYVPTAAPLAATDEDDNDFSMFDQLEDVDYSGLGFGLSEAVTTLPEFEQAAYLSLYDIWHILGLEEVSENRMKHAIGVPITVDVKAPHYETAYGPTFIVGEENKVQKGWASKKSGILMRLQNYSAPALEDDM